MRSSVDLSSPCVREPSRASCWRRCAPPCSRCMPRQRARGRGTQAALRNARRAGATHPRYLRRKQRIRDAAAEDAAAVAVAPPAGGGWAATRLAQPLRTASAWVEALHPAVHRAGAGLRACTTRAPCKSELQGAGTQPAAAPLTARPECSASERARREYAYLGAAAAARFGGTQPSMQVSDATALLPTLAAAASPRVTPNLGGRRGACAALWQLQAALAVGAPQPQRTSAQRSSVGVPRATSRRHDLPATPAPAERYRRREAIGQRVRLGVEDDAPPYAPNSAPYQNFAGRLSTWSTCTCFTSVYSRMPSRPNSRPMPLCL